VGRAEGEREPWCLASPGPTLKPRADGKRTRRPSSATGSSATTFYATGLYNSMVFSTANTYVWETLFSGSFTVTNNGDQDTGERAGGLRPHETLRGTSPSRERRDGFVSGAEAVLNEVRPLRVGVRS
jgi:hypothetical protein